MGKPIEYVFEGNTCKLELGAQCITLISLPTLYVSVDLVAQDI